MESSNKEAAPNNAPAEMVKDGNANSPVWLFDPEACIRCEKNQMEPDCLHCIACLLSLDEISEPEEFTWADCEEIIKSIAKERGLKVPPIPLISNNDEILAGYALKKSYKSPHHFYVYEKRNCIQIKGYCEEIGGKRKKMLNEYYDKRESLEGFELFLDHHTIDFFCLCIPQFDSSN